MGGGVTPKPLTAVSATYGMSYVFKDDKNLGTNYRDYNKEDNDKCLIGNWVEERALKEDVGTFRYPKWVNADPDQTIQDSRYTKNGLHSGLEADNSGARVLTHSDYVHPSNYVTANNVPADTYRVYHDKEAGALTTARDKKYLEAAMLSESSPASAVPTNFVSEATASFYTKPPIALEERGKRVMLNQHMEKMDIGRDTTFLKEHGLIDPKLDKT